jgi:hypothetical protein
LIFTILFFKNCLLVISSRFLCLDRRRPPYLEHTPCIKDVCRMVHSYIHYNHNVRLLKSISGYSSSSSFSSLLSCCCSRNRSNSFIFQFLQYLQRNNIVFLVEILLYQICCKTLKGFAGVGSATNV